MGPGWFRAAAAGAGLVFASCGSPADPNSPDEGAPGWQPSVLLRAPGVVRRDSYSGTYPPDIGLALDAAGRGWAVWTHHQPPHVEAARWDEAWQPPILVHDSSAPVDGLEGRDAHGGSVAVGSAGEAIVGWTESRGDLSTWVAMARRWTGSAWEPALRVQDVPSGAYADRGHSPGIPDGPSVFIAGDRGAWLLWPRTTRGSYPNRQPVALMASRRLPSGEWTPEQTIADESIYQGGAVAAPLPGGELLAVWSHGGALRSALLSPSRSFEYGLAGADASSILSIAAAPDGGALVSWVQGPYTPFHDLALMRIGGGLEVGAPVPIAPTGNSAARVEVSRRGIVFVGWMDGATLWSRSAPSPGAAFGPAAAVATVDPSFTSSARSATRHFQLAVDDGGNAFMAWVDGDFTPAPRLLASRFTAGLGWSAPVVLHASTQRAAYSEPAVAADAAGNAIVAFSVAPALGLGDQVEIRAARYVAR